MKLFRLIIMFSGLTCLVSCSSVTKELSDFGKPKIWHCYRQVLIKDAQLPRDIEAVTRSEADKKYCEVNYDKNLHENCAFYVDCSLK